MQTVSTIGLDIAKSVFQVHGVDCNGPVGSEEPTKNMARKRGTRIALVLTD
jgi:hypothetical protein